MTFAGNGRFFSSAAAAGCSAGAKDGPHYAGFQHHLKWQKRSVFGEVSQIPGSPIMSSYSLFVDGPGPE